MSERTKKPPTKTTKLQIIGPKRHEKAVRCYLADVGFRVLDDDEVFWEDAFPEHTPGDLLRAARAKEEMSQAALSTATSVPQRHISEIESGKRPIGKVNAQKFAKVLGISYKVFL